MPMFVLLVNLTEQGAKNIKEAPARVQESIKAAEAAGVKMLGFYVTMGQYDYVAVADCPSDEAALLQLLGLNLAGNVKTTTLKAFTVEEFAETVKKLP